MNNIEIKKAVLRSQHCQRNWDLSKEIPQEDLDLIIHAATQCPSKQNIAFYKVHFITNRSLIETIHSKTAGFKNHDTGEYETNSQTLANLLIAFESEDYINRHTTDTVYRNDELWSLDSTGKMSSAEISCLDRDAHMAIGISAGYVNLTSSMLGYSTGCCACFNPVEIAGLIGANNPIKLLMGVGFKDESRPRREHHTKPEFVFPTKKKQEISVNIIK
jgi:nitroreductase